MWHGYDGMGLWMVLDGILWVVLLGAILGLALRVLRRRAPGEPLDALEIAERRYARGQIDAEELAEMRRNLSPAPRREAA